MTSKLYPQVNGYFLSANNTAKNWFNKQIVNLLLLICFFVPFVSNAQQMLTTPTTLYNYQTDVSTNKAVSLSISEDGNVVVKGSPYANAGIGAVTLYFRGNDGVWSPSQLAVGSGLVGNAQFGSAVAISADGSTIVVGANNDDNGVGAIWVYKRVGTANSYNQFGNKILPKDFNGKPAIGTSVGISADGNTIIVGGPKDGLDVSVFESNPKQLKIFGITINLPVPDPNQYPIYPVSYSFKKMKEKLDLIPPPFNLGNDEIKSQLDNVRNDLGAQDNDIYRYNVGAAWVFKYGSSANAYYQDGDKMQNKGLDGLFPASIRDRVMNFGPSAALVPGLANSVVDDITNTIKDAEQKANDILNALKPIENVYSWLIGTILPSKVNGYVFTRNCYNIQPELNPLSPNYSLEMVNLFNATNSRLYENAYQGSSVSISNDGKTVMMGAPGLLNGKGITYVYRLDSSSKVWIGEDVLVGDNSNGVTPIAFGNNLAISPDGLNAIIGSPNSLKGSDTTGAAQVFVKNTSTKRWSKVGNNIVPSDATIGTNKKLGIGNAFAFSSDNDDLLIGAPFDNNGKGAMWLYKPVSGTWTKQQKLTPSLSNGNFGSSLAIGEYGLTAVVGAPNLTSGGSAYVYNSCEPPKPILAQYADTICSGYQFNNYYQYNKRLNSATSWVWRVGSETGSVFTPGTGESANNDGLVKKTLSGTTTYFVRGEGGCVNGKSVGITTIVKPTPTITSVTPNYVCNGGQITLNATANSGKVQWIGSTWDGLRYSSYGFYDTYESSPNYTAPYNYYARNTDPKQPPYSNGAVLATGNTYKPTINNSRNFYVSSMLNGCWSDTASVNARIERIVDIAIVGSGTQNIQICDSPRLTYPLTLNAWAYNDYRNWQIATPFPEKKAIPTQLPFTYKYYIDSAGMNLLETSSQNQKTVDMGGYVSYSDLIKDRNSLYKYYYYTITNACGTSAPYQIIAKRDPGPAMSHLFIKADSQFICPGTQANLTLQNTRSSELGNYSFRIYDSSAGNNLLDTSLPNWQYYWDFSTGSSVWTSRYAANYKTPVLNSSKNYYINVYNSCGESRFRTPVYVKVDVLNPPQVYNINATPVCDSGQILLSAQANDGSVLWYTSPSPTATPLTPNTLYDGQYLTPKLTASRTYYVGSTGQKCFGSPRISVPATVYETPILTVNKTSYTSCIPGADIYLSATTTIGAVYWYDSPTSTTPIWTQPTFRVYPGVTTTYYVESLTSSSCKSARVPVTVYINQPPVITQVVPGSRVNAGTVNLSATADYGTVNWTATDGTLLGLGNNYTTWSLNTTTTYYASASTADTGCISTVRVPVVATINYVPIVNTTMNASRCGAGSVTLSASAEVGTIRWFDGNSNQVGTGNTFTTPSLNATTTYYAQSWYLNSNSQYVQSAMVPVKAFINTISTPTITYSGGCVGQQPRVNISSLQNGVRYSLRNGTTVLDSKIPNGINNNFDLVAPQITATTTYNVFAEKFDSSTALRFDGDNDYVEVLNHAALNPFGEVMLGAWIKKDNVLKTQVIISKGSFANNNGYELSISNDNKLTFDIGSQRFQTTATIGNDWTHVAALYNNGIKLYINGNLSASFNYTGAINNNQGNLIIGSSQDYKGDATYGFSGAIDEVSVFCGVNFNTSIADMMNGKLVGNEYGLQLYYNFEHGANITNIIDVGRFGTAYAKNGILRNMDSVNAWVNGPGIVYCSSQISSSTLTPVTVPTLVTAFGSSRVGPGSITLTAVSSAGATTQWFTDSTSITPIATGINYVIPLLNFTTKYYVAANNGCSSTKVPIYATIEDLPDNLQINCISSPTDINLVDVNQGNGTGWSQILRKGYTLFLVKNDGTLRIYTTASGSISYVSSFALPNEEITHIEVANGYLYASGKYSRKTLSVIDISDIASLKLVGSSNINSVFNNPSSFVVDGLYAFTASRDEQKLFVTYIGQPSVNIYNSGSVNLSGPSNIVQKKDNIVYVGIDNVGIQLVDVNNVYGPYVTKTLSLPQAYGGSNNFYVKGNYLYVSPYVSASTNPYTTVLKVYDITTASNPVFIRDVTITDGFARSFASDTKYLYLGTYSTATGINRIQVLDISNPSNPSLVAAQSRPNRQFEVDGMAVRMGHIYTIGFSLDDNAVPTAASITGTKPASRYGTGTVILSATATGGTINWYAAASGGSSLGTGTNFTTPSISATTTYYVAATDGNCASARTPVIATVVDVPPCINSSSDLGTPSFINTGVDVKKLYRSGNYIYFIGESYIYVYNISSGSPVLTSTYNLGNPGSVYDIKVVNNYLYAVTRTTEKLYIVDISNPASLQPVGSTGSIFNIPAALWVEGNFAYVNNSDNHSLDVINISNPSAPSRVGQLSGLGDPSLSVQKKGNYLYLSNWANGFTIVDVSNPTSPILVQHINSKESGDIYGANNLYIIGKYLYVASNQGAAPRIKVYDISNPTNPSLVNTITTPFNVLSFDYDGIYLYCGLNKYDGNGNNILVYRMTNLANPTLVGNANTRIGGAYETSVVGIAATSIGGNGRIFAAGSSFPGYSLYSFPVSNSPTITSVTANSRCGSGSVSLQATSNGGTITWYSDSAATTALGTGSTFNTPSISTSTTYYVSTTNGGCILPSIPVLATVNPMPVATSTTGATRRDTGTVTLQATANTGTLNWYTVSTGGTSIDIGENFETPVINNTTTFYVESKGSLCTSVRVPVVATVITTPVIRSVTDGSRCLAGTVTLSATASIGTISWYDNNSSTTVLGTGNIFTTPSLSASRSYYVSTSNNGETSSRVAVYANIGSTPANAYAGSDINNFCGSSINFTADSVNGSSGQWSLLSGTGTFSSIYGINTTLSGIAGNTQVLWTVRKQFCPDKVDTVNINAAKPKPIFYSVGYDCKLGVNNLAKFDANKDSITYLKELWGTPDINNIYGSMIVSSNGKMYGISENAGANNRGAIFEFDPRTQTLKVIYSFTQNDGVNPRPPLVETSPGIFWGTTGSGGANNRGVVYKFNVNTNQYTVVRNSPSTGDSYAEAIAQKGSKLYFISRDASQLHEIDTATNAFVVKYTFPNNYVNIAYYNVVIAADGNLYGLVPNGTNGYGELFQYNFTANTHSIKLAPTNNSFGQGFSTKLTLASNNKMYWVGQGGGANGNGTIMEYDPVTNTATKKFDFNSAQNVSGDVCQFVQASDGYLYAASRNGGLNNKGGVFRYNINTGAFNVVKYHTSCLGMGNFITEYTTSGANAGVDSTICGNTYNLTALGASYGTGTWTIVKGSATIANVNNANSGITLNTDTAILRWTITDGACFTSFDEVQIIRKALPVITASGLQSCTAVNGNYTLTATSAGATLNWYADSTGTQVIGTGSTFAIAASGGSAKVFVAATANGCTSARTPIVISLPIIISTTPGVRCSAGSVKLQATANTGIINWYATATGGTSLGTGYSFTTPTVTGTTTYYAEASQNGCASARIAVTATITDNYNVSVNPVLYSFSSIANSQADLATCPNSAPKLYTISLADNDLTTGVGTVNYTGESWIQAKFATQATVTNVVVAGGNICNFGSGIATYLNGSLLQSSTDGANWTTRATVSGATDNATTSINVGSVTAQYWRLYKSGNNYVAAGEFSFSPMPTTVSPLMANAGPDQNNCSSTFTVSGNTPTQGFGVWSVISGKATITNPTSPTTTVTGVSGTAILRWSFNSTDCGVSFDDVALTANVKPILWGVTDNYIYNYNSANNTINTQLQNNGSNSTLFKGSNNKMYLFNYSSNISGYQMTLGEYLPNKATANSIRPTYNSSGYFEDNGVIYYTGTFQHFTYNINTGVYGQTQPVYAAIPNSNVNLSQPVTKIGNNIFGVGINYNNGNRFFIYSQNVITFQTTVRYTFPTDAAGSGPGSFVLGTNGKLYGLSYGGGTSSLGYIYEFDTATNTLTNKYNFASYNSSSGPGCSNFFLASNNKIYGTFLNGGGNNAGALWEYDYLNNSFSIKNYFNRTTTTGGNPSSGFNLMQASDGKIYGATQYGGTYDRGMIYSYDISTNALTYLQSINIGNESSYRGKLVEYNDLIADAGPDQNICGSTATMAANTAFAGTGTWTVVAGTATITNANSPTTTVTNLKGTVILRWTLTTGACSTSFDDVVINSQGIITVTDGKRCGTGTGPVTLGATASVGMNINWYDSLPTTSTAAAPGNAIDFNGSNQSITIPHNAAYNFTDKYTFESWINIKAYQYGTFVSKFEDDNNNRSWMINMGETGDYTKITVVQTQLGTWTNPIQWNTGFTPSLNTWYHIAVVYDGTLSSNHIKLYVNGVLTSQTNWAYTLTPNTANLYLGGYDGAGNGLNAGANSRYINGKMDEVRLWNTARTATEIGNTYNTTVQSNSTGLVAYFKLDETSGSIVTDASSTNNNGTLTNSPSRFATSLVTQTIYTPATLLGTGNSFTTPSIATTKTYYALASGNGCTSAYTPVVATIAAAVPTPTITASGSTTICNGTSVSLVASKPFLNDAIKFTSSNQNYVRDVSPYYAFSNAITIEGWINCEGNIYMGQSSSNVDNQSTNVWLWYGSNSNMQAYVNYGGSWKLINYTPPSSGWHHYATVFSSAGAFSYIDGVQVTNSSPAGVSGTIQNNAASILDIGREPRYNNTYGNFQTNEFRIWNVARTQSQIVANMNSTISPSTTGLVGYYQFNAGMGTTTQNYATGQNSVSLGNNPTITSNITYLWSLTGEKTSTINANAAGSYTVTATDANGCSATSTATTVTLNGTGVVANAGADQVNCSGSFTMAANGTGSWSVVSGAATITTASSATTAVTVSSGAATLRWTTTTSCGTTTDDVVLTKTSSAPMLLYPSNSEPGCTYCGVGSLNLLDGNRNEIISKKSLGINTTNGATPSDIGYLFKASDGVIYGIASTYLYNNNTQTDNTSNIFYYDPITNKPIYIQNFSSGNNLRNITEYNGILYCVLGNNTIYKISMKSKQYITNISIPSNISFNGNPPSSGLTVVGNKMYGLNPVGIYEFNPATETFTWKYSYSSANLGGTNGNENAGELILASNGKLYGKTHGGGANGNGTLFEYDPVNNTATVKVNFSSGSTGLMSRRTAVLTSNNLLYGTCEDGGANNRGTLWEYNISTNTFTVKYHFTNTNTNPRNQFTQASNGKLYGVCGGPEGYGQLYSFDISNNVFSIIKNYDQFTGRVNNYFGPLLEEKFLADAGSDIIACSSTATMAAAPNFGNVGAGKWTVVSGAATFANADSANTIVTGLSGVNTLRYTTNYGACSSSFDDVVIYAKPAVPTVTNGSRCGTGAGTVNLAATTNSATGVIKWYADSVGGASLATGTSFTTPSISATTTYYADVTDKYNSRNITYTVSNLYEQCNFNNSALNDNNFTTGVVVNGNPSFIQASFDSAYIVNSIYLAAGLLCNGASTIGFQNYYGAPAIYYSNDNINWTYVRGTGGMTDYNGKQQYYIGGITAKYWRLQNPNNISWPVAVTEFSFDFVTNFSCTSNRVPVTAYIGTTPTVTSTTNGNGCTTATLQATASSGSINWYAAATGGTALATGNSFTTPALTNNTTYYASAINTGCESSRTPVTASINVPSITCAADMVVGNTYGQCGATVTVTAPTISNTCGGAAPTLTNNFNNTANASGNYPIGTTTVVWTATNTNGNTATCTQLVTVNDNQSPNAVCQNKTLYLDASGSATITATQLNNGSSDNCVIASYNASKTSFDCSNLGANQVILTVTDINGNDASCASTVTALDTIKPVITAPANISVNSTTGVCGATVSFAATATDNCSVNSITYSPASGNLFAIGTTTVTAIATDASGNSNSATFTVTVVDNQNPTITCPANITVSCSASTDTSNTGRATATDNCSVQSITYNDVSTKSNNNSLCSYYTYSISRTWTATDINGRTSSCVQTITVIDNVKPVITSSGNNLSLGCNPSQAAIDAALGTATATDNCSTMGIPTATDGAVIVNGILRSQTRSFNISDVCGNAATTVTRTATWTILSPASVSIVASANNICAGTSITFTATPTSGGTNPTYQWSKNGVEISGETSVSYNYIPANGDVITCAMTARNTCETGVVVNSNSITVTVGSQSSSTTNLSICPSELPYSWNGSRTVGGTYSYATINSQGCDSIATLNLTVKTNTTSITNVYTCPSALPYNWNGNSYNAAGKYTFTTTNSQGCDSIVILNLVVNSVITSVTDSSICATELPFIWNGLTFYGASSKTKTGLISVLGCDSSAVLSLTIRAASASTANINVCQITLPYTWNGLTFNTSGSQTAHFINSVGCDSAATLILNAMPNGTWIGAVSTNMSTAANWCGGVPSSNSNIIISSSSNDPILSSNLVFNNIELNDTMVLGGNKLTVNGVISGNNKIITGSNTSSIEYASSNSSIIGFNQFTSSDATVLNGTNALKDLLVSGLGGSLTISNKLNLFDRLSVSAGTLNSAGNIVLRSTANNTAYVDKVGGGINGEVTVERYIHNQYRGWRALTAPITYYGLIKTDSSNTLKRNWQSDWGYGNNYGTSITAPVTPSYANGIDNYSPTSNIRTFNSNTGAWFNIENSITELQSGNSMTAANKSFFFYIRGDRTVPIVTGSSGTPVPFVPTTIASKGLLQTGTQVFNYDGSLSQYWLVGNPYACPVDMSSVNNNVNNLGQFVYVWDPNLANTQVGSTSGNYTTFDRTNWDFGPISGETNKYFQSGQAFFVLPTNASATMTFTENDKTTSANNNTQTSGSATNTTDIFSIKLLSIKNDGTKTEIDGTRAKFGNYSNVVDAQDGVKFTSAGIENLFLKRSGKNLAIESRPYIIGLDTLFLNTTNLSVGSNYEFKLNPINFDASVSSCKLIDNFLNTETPISLTNTTLVSFNVTSVTGSNAANRFYVVFNAAGSLPTSNSLTVKAYKQNNSVKIDWEAIAENNVKTYTVEKSTDANSFTKLSETTAKNGNTTNAYSVVDNNPVMGVNYYRIQSTETNNNKTNSAIVRVEMSDKGIKGITVYPNPVKGNVIGVQMNNLELGKYTAKLFNVAGQEIWTNVINHNGNGSISLQLKNALSSGAYQLQFIDTKGNSYKQSVLVVE